MCKRIFLGLMAIGVCILIFGTYRLSDGKEKNIVSKPSRPQNIKVNLQYTGELRLGKVISLEAEVMPDCDVSKMKVSFGYRRNDGDFDGGGIRYLGPNKFDLGQVKKDEKHTFNVDIIIEKEGTYLISVGASSPVPGREDIPTIAYEGRANIPEFYIDEKEFEWGRERLERERERQREYERLHPKEGECRYFPEDKKNRYYLNGKWVGQGEGEDYWQQHWENSYLKGNCDIELAQEIDKIPGLTGREKVGRYEEEHKKRPPKTTYELPPPPEGYKSWDEFREHQIKEWWQNEGIKKIEELRKNWKQEPVTTGTPTSLPKLDEEEERKGKEESEMEETLAK
ncbi:MAG: hypothetical protein AB1414_05565 [bacterium]